MGVAGLTALAVETVTYFLLPQLSLCFSYRIMMFFGLILVAVRYFVYGFVQNPWWLVLPECFKGNLHQFLIKTMVLNDRKISYECGMGF